MAEVGMDMENADFRRLAFLAKVGENIRELREAGGFTQQEVADWFDWNRDAISKVERGRNNLTLYDYLQLMQLLRDMSPDHPGVQLGKMLLPVSRRSSR